MDENGLREYVDAEGRTFLLSDADAARGDYTLVKQRTPQNKARVQAANK